MRIDIDAINVEVSVSKRRGSMFVSCEGADIEDLASIQDELLEQIGVKYIAKQLGDLVLEELGESYVREFFAIEEK